MSEKQVLAVDYGASGGRVMLGGFDGASFTISELHRFPNDPVKLGDTMYWDVLRLYFEMKQGIVKSKAYGAISGIGVDTWGVDFGLLDREGRLLDNPVHYRDGRTAGMMEKTLKMVGRDPLYELTGNQMMDMRQGEWAFGLLETLGLQTGMMRDILPGAVRTGSLRPEIQKELGVPAMEVIAVAGHDTQSAMAAIPAREEDFLFISCGTWGLFGTELPEPVISEMSKKFNITNEAGLEGNYAFLKNIIGLWLIQESRRQWIREGKEYGFGELETKAACTEPLKSLINPDAPEFVPSGDIPERIRQFCRKTRQPVPQSEGEIVCCIDQSLALAYRKAMDEIRACTGKQYPVIHLIGGGAQSGLLCQMTANACGLPVVAGPVEATVYGNTMAQFMALGELNGLTQARRALADTLHTVVYEPRDREIWEEAYERYREIL